MHFFLDKICDQYTFVRFPPSGGPFTLPFDRGVTLLSDTVKSCGNDLIRYGVGGRGFNVAMLSFLV